ncbi:hypothetical protein B0H17DRAFT_1209058 [Mycena rosella]|uniref:Uncharacterized protein n=1 Tax=Mycena rosella TaxID=1033263 RepID=A0AAD7CZR1_MYCRO|nr:hypothetical protein B0H17DRAFT_1209058 [Mycena rosella]
MDPISAATTFITLATFIKDLLDLGQSIKRSIKQVGENKKRIHGLIEDVLHTLTSLAELTRGRERTFHAPQLLSALGDLKADMLHVLSKIERVAPVEGRAGLRGLGAHLKNWLRREDVEIEIQNLKQHMNKCYIQFTAFSAARVEYTTLRVEQAILVNNVENGVKLRRLEGMMARLLLDTQFGANIVHQAADIIASDSTHQTLESKYLSVQTMRLVDFLDKLTLNHNLRFEVPLWDPVTPMAIRFLPSASFVHVLHTVLGMVIEIEENQFPAKNIANDLLNLGSHLSLLGMLAEATASDVLSVQFLRCLASGNDSIGIIPRLAFSLYNLAKRYHRRCQYRLALQATQQSLDLCQLLSELSPDVDNAAMSLAALIEHLDCLRLTGQLQDAVSTAQQAVLISGRISAEILASYPFDVSGFQRLSPEHEWRAAKCCEAFFALARALSFAGHYHAAYKASKEGLEMVVRFSGSIRPPSVRETDMIFDQLCKLAEKGALSLSILADIGILYRHLSCLYRTEFTLRFPTVLYAHAYICVQENSSSVASTVNLQVLLDADTDAYPPVLHLSNVLPFLADDSTRVGAVMEDAIWGFYVSDCLPEAIYPVSPLVQYFFVEYFDLAHAILRKAVKSLSETSSDPKILSFAVAKISDTVSSVSGPQQLILLDTTAELVTHFRTIIKSSGSSQNHGNFFIYALWWYCWALWFPGRLAEALEITEEAIRYIRAGSGHENRAELDDWLLDQAFILFDMGRILDASRLLETLDASDENDSDHGYFYCFLRSHVLRRTGRYEEASILLTEVDRDQQIERFIANVDLAAVNLDLGHLQAAIKCAEDVVVDLKRSPQDGVMAEGDNSKSVLAYALTTLSNCFAEVGRHEEGLVASQEASMLIMSMKQPLINWPAVIRSQDLMASTLHALSMRLMTAKEPGEALSIAEKATGLYRELVSLAPRYLPSLANSLKTLALIFWDVGRRDESIFASKEAIEITQVFEGRQKDEPSLRGVTDLGPS